MDPRPSRLVCACAVLLVLSGLTGCGSKGGTGRVLVLGFDGMDPAVVDLLVSEGKMPHFGRLRQEGAYSRLLSEQPLLSPVVWTTIATGKNPEQHGIGHFVAVNEKTGQQLPVTSQMRKVKAIWNILSEAGRRVGVVGYWATWPAETVNGYVVSDHTCYHFLFEDGFKKNTDSTGRVYPPSLEPEVDSMLRRPSDLTMADVAPFVHVTEQEFNRPFSFEDDLSHFKWALSTALNYTAIGLKLWQEQKPDLQMVYIEATDSTAHLFGHLFRAKQLAGELAEQQKRYGDAVEQMYLQADVILGQYMDLMDPSTTLFVLSDHGFELGALPDDPSKTRDMRRVSEKYHHIQGILYVYGNHVRPHTALDRPTILDITPTILALQGLPPARDMPGRVLNEGLDFEPPWPGPVTYEHGPHATTTEIEHDANVDPAIVERLKSLGYLDASSPQGDRNLAAVQFQDGHFSEAEKAYRELVRQHPEDGSLHASLAGALGALGRYDDAVAELEQAIKIEPLNPEAYHNRAVIEERRGQRDAAIRDYQTALRYNPQYDPSRQALERLGAQANPQEPRTDAERLAASLSDQASQAARRGDYKEAMSQLDQAQRVAPNYVLVYQYRANVAFLMGDSAAAADALRHALQIEPDNALFQANLDRLLGLTPAAGTSTSLPSPALTAGTMTPQVLPQPVLTPALSPQVSEAAPSALPTALPAPALRFSLTPLAGAPASDASPSDATSVPAGSASPGAQTPAQDVAPTAQPAAAPR